MKESLARILLYSSILISIIISVFMLVFRFSFLNEPPIYDEIYSLATANPLFSFHTAWHDILLKDVNLPLYNLLLRAWAAIVPFTLPWMRLFSALFSAAVVPAAWFCAPSYWPKLKKFIFCTLLASSLVLTNFGSLLRSYPVGIFTLTISLLFALRILHALTQKQSISPKTWITFFTCGFISSYLHYFASALFFITALWIFIYTLIYKKYRMLVFGFTALCFVAWIPWIVHTYYVMNHFQSDWWYQTGAVFSSWNIVVFLCGSTGVFFGLVCLLVLGSVSFISAEKKTSPAWLDIFSSLFQLVLLVTVVYTISLRYNLWLDRYFAFCLPSFFILLTALLYQLYQRMRASIVLLPVLLSAWLLLLWLHWPTMQDISGLTLALNYLTHKPNLEKVLVIDLEVIYPKPAQQFLFSYYLPKDKKLSFEKITRENASLVWQHTPVLMPVCSFVGLLRASEIYNFEVPEPVISFQETCILEQPYD